MHLSDLFTHEKNSFCDIGHSYAIYLPGWVYQPASNADTDTRCDTTPYDVPSRG